MADLDPTSLHKLRVVDLKEILAKKGLSTSGLKADLVKRLREAICEKSEEHESDGVSLVADESELAYDNEARQDPMTNRRNSSEHENSFSECVQMKQSHEAVYDDEPMEFEQERFGDASDRRVADERQKNVEDEQKRMAEEHQRRLNEEESERQRIDDRNRQFAEEQERRMLEQQKFFQEQRRYEEERKMQEAEMLRLREEEMRKKQAEATMRSQIAEQQKMLAEKEKIRLAEEQQRLLAEEQKRLMAEEQRRLLAEEQQRLLVEEQQQKLLAEQQQKLLAEQQQKQLAEEQQKIIAEQQQKFLGEQQQKMLAEQQVLSERDKEKELFQLQQQALREKEGEKLQQVPLPMVTSNPVVTHVVTAPAAAVVTSLVTPHLPIPVPPPIPQPPQLSHVLPVSSQPTTSNTIPIFSQMPPPLSTMNVLRPPSTILVSSLTARAPPGSLASSTTVSANNMSHQIAPPGLHPPTMPSSIQFSQPPPPATTPVVPTSVSTAFPHPPPPLPSTTLNSKPAPNQKEITEKQPDNSSKNESQVSATVSSNSDQTDEIKLPHAVEKILALKNERAQQLGVDPDSVVEPAAEMKESTIKKSASRALVSVDEDDEVDEEEANLKTKESKSRRRKKKKKKRAGKFDKQKPDPKKKASVKEKSVDIDIEYVQDVLDPSDPLYSQFVRIFEKFKLSDPDKDKIDAALAMEEAKQEPKVIDRKKPMDIDDDDDDDDDRDEEKKEEEKPKLSKRKLKKLSRMTVAELKQKVSRPELVEMHDVTAKDPVLLLHLKASRNTVPVPRHWCFKRKYLQGKRGIEKPAFELPDFIKRTGIMEMRQALQEKEDQKTMKAKMRERVRPKLGKIDIDYQKLHDAFFKWQTKPKMTIHGDLYYEGKEFETRLKEKKPGDLSDDLRVALGMPTGPNANKCPPPWLIAMQRYGPPPSYPNLKIPGLNAPIPDSCSFGYHAGGWGKPPVDEMGRPLYGDVFGTQNADNQPHIPEEEIDHTLWGELESESSEEEEDEEDEDEEEEEQKGEDETGLVTPAEGLITPSGFSSIPAGMETPDMIELRKRKIEAEMEGGETPALYTILPEKKSERVGAAMMGSTHIYDLAAAIPAAKVKIPGTASVPPQGIEVALDPSELEMDTAAMAARYEQTMREQQSQLEKEDLSDMVAEHAARQKTKRKKQQQDSGKAPKKYKEFKF